MIISVSQSHELHLIVACNTNGIISVRNCLFMLESLSNAMILSQINAKPVLEVKMAIPKLELITLEKVK